MITDVYAIISGWYNSWYNSVYGVVNSIVTIYKFKVYNKVSFFIALKIT